jgi:hypothetical protein
LNSYLTKRIYVYSGIGFTLLLILVWLTGYLSSGKIVVNTNGSNTIILQKTSSGKPFIATGTGSLSASVKHGQYTATIKNGSQTTAKVINFSEGHKTFRYTIDLPGMLGIEPVADQDAEDIVASDNELVYLNADDGNLYKIDSDNNLSVVNSSQTFLTIKWADTSFGVGQGNDGRLYAINNGSVSLLNVPFSYNTGPVSFAVSPSKQVYVSYGADVYIGSQNGSYKKIYMATTSTPALSAGTNHVDVADGTLDQSIPVKPDIAIVNTSGKYIRKIIDSSNSLLSPNDNYLAIQDESGIAEVYNKSLEQPVTLPRPVNNTAITHITWLNDNTILYSSGYQLWEYNVPQQQGELLANMPLDDSITGLSINKDRSYGYITTADSNGNNQVMWRVGLKGQTGSALVNQLQQILPVYEQPYQLSYVNFSGTPVVDISQVTSGTQNPQQLATQELQSLGVDTSQLEFSVVSQ